ncbi:MAG: GNAT family N-acetyltransferase, partial [Flavobacteriaceae bacterium]|nr:GNAT family N-acetyltransferase [Flavobacteriaceae bacterium]
MAHVTQATTDKDLREILHLQQLHLPDALTSEEIQDGFVTVSHSLSLLRKMNEACPHTIAKDDDRVVGYALSMHPKFKDEIDILKPMFVEIDSTIRTLPTKTKKAPCYMVMGQICITKSYRRQGLFRSLYDSMAAHLPAVFEYIITEVDLANTHSL